MENDIPSYVFKHPFTCMIAGPSKSGKTTLLKKILPSFGRYELNKHRKGQELLFVDYFTLF